MFEHNILKKGADIRTSVPVNRLVYIRLPPAILPL
jgi:hypothetical protein